MHELERFKVDKPVVINEASDNCGGGAPGDATHLLRAILDAAPMLPPHSCVFTGMVDPVVAAQVSISNLPINTLCSWPCVYGSLMVPSQRQAHAVGVGATIACTLGGRASVGLSGQPLAVEAAYVKTLSDGKFTLTHWAPGLHQNLGKSAGLVIGGVDVLVISHRQQSLDAGLLYLHGIDPGTKRLIGLKSECHFRAGFTDLSSVILTADEPGMTTARVESFVRTRQVQPLLPKDANASFAVEDELLVAARL